MKNYYISEGVKALFSIYFKDQTEENFIKALNEFNKENQINSQEIKDEALREIKEELSKLATTDLLNAKIDKVDTRIDKVENKLDSFKTEVKTYVIILAALMFILQPTIFDLILSIFKSFLRQ
ncbi:hypothetical protein GJO29_09075 [Campylobacter coli]|uniref:hypothetical protein n=1 Tax=Campylobacter coli TaxID=195 RepID=UPI000707F81F|nr:hypothetical protein [Campylobacter coli]EAH4945293.1 hypothetical protein [Campylobacter coli]EAH4987622.1 hypothetical protein [Campylobacter coli]EAH5012410.1 hypothetical protein [Campylobacter coli]EAH6403142.1 hypothetical protein [Campylobacter coli]EAH6560058.1 hypothetical protein [Campylobacter coli]